MNYTFEKTLDGYVMKPLKNITAVLNGKSYFRKKDDYSGTWNTPIETEAIIITEGVVNIDISDSAAVEFKGIVVLRNCNLKITGEKISTIENSYLSGDIEIQESSVVKSTLNNSTVKQSQIQYSIICGGLNYVTFSNIKFAIIDIDFDEGKTPLTFCDAEIKSQFDIAYVYCGKRTEYAYRVKGNGWTDVMFNAGRRNETTRFPKEINSISFAKDLMSMNNNLNKLFETISISCIKTLSGFLAVNYSYDEHLKKLYTNRSEYDKLVQPGDDRIRFLSPEFNIWCMYYEKFLFREIYDENEILKYFPVDIIGKKIVFPSNFALLDKNTARNLGDSIFCATNKTGNVKLIDTPKSD